jgi:CRP/FNR family transcriptional regulator, cyclic AMP receptor protein
MIHPIEATVPSKAGAEATGPDSGRVAEALHRCVLFRALNPVGLDRLTSHCTLVRIARRRPVYSQGQPASTLYVIASGRVRVVREAHEARALTVAYRGPGEVIGETAISDTQSYRETASATEQAEAVRIPLSALRTLLENQPGFASVMLDLMLDRRLEAERRVESLLSRSVESRVAEFLIDAAARYGIPDSRGTLIGVKYTHQEIADYVGSTRETVTLTLGELKRRGLLQFEHRRIVLGEMSALQAIV